MFFGVRRGLCHDILTIKLLFLHRLLAFVWTVQHCILGRLGMGLGLVPHSVERVYQRLDQAPVSLYLCAHFRIDFTMRLLKFSRMGRHRVCEWWDSIATYAHGGVAHYAFASNR